MRRPRGPDGVRGALWQSLAVFRWVTFGYAVVIVGRDLDQADRPAFGLAWFGVMAVWSAVMSLVAPALHGRRPHLLNGLVVADVVVSAAIVLTTGAADLPGSHVLPALWSASGVFSAALVGGTVGGSVGGLVLAIVSFVAAGDLNDASFRPAVLFALAGTVVGYLSSTAILAEAALAEVLEARAGDAERERLARGVHDGVLQVLALIAREAPRGMGSADVSKLAAEQESALRDLLRTPRTSQPLGATPRPAPGRRPALGRRPAPGHPSALLRALGLGRTPGPARLGPPETDLVVLLRGMTRTPLTRMPVLTIATPGTAVPLRTDHAYEMVAAVQAALDNVAGHAGPGASAWVLLEDDGDEVTVTVRDDGVGMAPGRVEQAAAAGRLGLAHSVVGRIRDLGGDVVVTGRPGQGTEVELRVPR